MSNVYEGYTYVLFVLYRSSDCGVYYIYIYIGETGIDDKNKGAEADAYNSGGIKSGQGIMFVQKY